MRFSRGATDAAVRNNSNANVVRLKQIMLTNTGEQGVNQLINSLSKVLLSEMQVKVKVELAKLFFLIKNFNE